MNERLLAAFAAYERGHASLDDLQRLLAMVDMDDPALPGIVRDSLMELDLIITGIQEGFGDEREVHEFLKNIPRLAIKTS